MSDKQVIWITWERQRRNRTLSSHLNAQLFELNDKGPRWKKHPKLLLRTLAILFNNQHKIVYAQNPSLLLAAASVFFSKLLRFTIIIDEHNWGLFPLGGNSWLLNGIARLVARHADVIIVSNESLAVMTKSWGANAVVLPDPLPVFDIARSDTKDGQIEITLVCTWADDEPYEAVFQAAHALPENVTIFITGRAPASAHEKALPKNVVLTGFLSDEEYVQRLSQSDFVMVLTTMEDCLNCGAYEAVALGKPMILSDTACLRGYFRQGATYAQSTPASIAHAITEAVQNKNELDAEVSHLKDILSAEWEISFQKLKAVVANIHDLKSSY